MLKGRRVKRGYNKKRNHKIHKRQSKKWPKSKRKRRSRSKKINPQRVARKFNRNPQLWASTVFLQAKRRTISTTNMLSRIQLMRSSKR